MSENKDSNYLNSINKILEKMQAATFPSALATLKESSYFKLAEQLQKSPQIQALRTLDAEQAERLLAITKVEVGHLDYLKRIGDFSRTLPVHKLALENEKLAAILNFSANNDAMKNMLDVFSHSSKEMTALKRAYRVSFPVFDTGVLDSLLFKYMSSHLSSTLTTERLVELQREVVTEKGTDADFVFNDIEPAMEAEIIEEIERGGDYSSLSTRAKQYLLKWWPTVLLIIDLMAHFITFDQYYEEKIAESKSAGEIKMIVNEIPREHRDMLEGQRIVIKENVILRSSPDTKSKELGRMKMGTRIDVESAKGFWVHVTVEVNGEDIKGWVYAPFTLKL
jgi:hypothetical protein